MNISIKPMRMSSTIMTVGSREIDRILVVGLLGGLVVRWFGDNPQTTEPPNHLTIKLVGLHSDCGLPKLRESFLVVRCPTTVIVYELDGIKRWRAWSRGNARHKRNTI